MSEVLESNTVPRAVPFADATEFPINPVPLSLIVRLVLWTVAFDGIAPDNTG